MSGIDVDRRLIEDQQVDPQSVDGGWRTISHQEALKILPDLEKKTDSKIEFIKKKPSAWFNLFFIKGVEPLNHFVFDGFTSKIHYAYESIMKLLREWKQNPPSSEVLKDFERCLDWKFDCSEDHYSCNVQPDFFDYMTEEEIIPLSKLLVHFGYRGLIPIKKGEWSFIVGKLEGVGTPDFGYELLIYRIIGLSQFSRTDFSLVYKMISTDFEDDLLTSGRLYKVMREWKTRPPSSFILNKFKEELNESNNWNFMVIDNKYNPRTFLDVYLDYCINEPDDYDEDFMELLVFFSGSNMMNETFARVLKIAGMERHLFEIKNKQRIVKWTEKWMNDEIDFSPMRARIEVGNMVQVEKEREEREKIGD